MQYFKWLILIARTEHMNKLKTMQRLAISLSDILMNWRSIEGE